jgi:hypothetical protein
MIDLNAYINKTVEIQLGDDLLHVKMPSVANMGKIAGLEQGLGVDVTTDYGIKQKTAHLLLNDNLEGKEIPITIVEKIPLNGIMAVVTTIFRARVELEKDPNSESQSQKVK